MSFMNQTQIRSHATLGTQIGTCFYVALMNKGHCVYYGSAPCVGACSMLTVIQTVM